MFIGGGGGQNVPPYFLYAVYFEFKTPVLLSTPQPLCFKLQLIHSNNTIAFQQIFAENNLEFLKLILQSKSTLPPFLRNFTTEKQQ